MIPNAFEYHAPKTLDDAIRLLGEHADEAKLLAGGHSLLRQGLGGALMCARHRDGPLIVVDHEDQRQLADTGEVHRFVYVTARGGAVADHADRRPALAAQLKGQHHTSAMRAVGADRNADRKVLARPGEVAASLVSAPVE